MIERTNAGETNVYLPCSCSAVGHGLMVTLFTDPPAAYLQAVKKGGGSLWARIKTAVRHVLGRSDCRYEDFEHVFTPEGAREVRQVLAEYLEAVGREP